MSDDGLNLYMGEISLIRQYTVSIPFETSGVDKWFEIDLTSYNIDCVKFELRFDGFVSEMEMYEVDIITE